MTIHQSVLDCIGNTPVVKLNRLPGPEAAEVYLKMECGNPAGSIKARPALSMIEDAERSGLLKPGAMIVEPTSGNQGIALAMIGAVKGYRVRIVMPESASIERRRILQAYGAEVVLTPIGENIQETFAIVLATAKAIRDAHKNAFMPNQFDNPANLAAHEFGTGEEIVADFPGGLDAFVAGIGTGGTITGVGKRLKRDWPGIKIVAVEPVGAPLLYGGAMTTHVQEGIGDGLMPSILDPSIIDNILLVSDDEAVATAKNLARHEGIFCGVSTGTTVTGALKIAEQLGRGAKVLAIMADGGEKYLSTRLCE